jgi:hypothetical protein
VERDMAITMPSRSANYVALKKGYSFEIKLRAMLFADGSC